MQEYSSEIQVEIKCKLRNSILIFLSSPRTCCSQCRYM